MAGRIRTHEINYEYQKVELGYFLFSDFVGNGLASLALAAVESHIFNTVGLNRVELFIDPQNSSSSKMAEKNGYTLEGTLREEYFNYYFKSLRDTQVWSKLKREFMGQK